MADALDLAPIKQRLDAAQVGDWVRLEDVYGWQWFMQMLSRSHATRVFVAHSRRDVAALVTEVERLRKAET